MRLIAFFFRRYPWQSLLVVLALLVATALEAAGLSVVVPLLGIAARRDGSANDGATSRLETAVLDGLEGLGLEPSLGLLIPLAIAAFWLKAGVLVLAYRRVARTVAHVATDLRLDLVRALLSARWGYYTRQPTGAAANAMATEADRSSRAYLEMAKVLTHSIESIAYAGLALAVSWLATLVTGVAAVVVVGGLSALVRVAARAGRKQTRLLKSLLGRLTDALQAVKLLKTTGHEGLIGPLLESDTLKLNRALRRQVLSREALRALQAPILVTIGLVASWVALAMLGTPLTGVLMILFLFTRTLQSVNKSQRRYQHMVMDASALWSLREMIERAEGQAEAPGGGAAPSLERGVTLDAVRLRYDELNVLDGATLEIPAGSITAISGPSGGGKTTIVDLVTGLVEPGAGEVRIDDAPLPTLDLRRWRQMIGYVPQEMLMLHDSVRVNVTLGDPDLTEEQVEAALRDAGAWEFVAQLPQGLDSSVGERGTLLSGGQRQRISIARALVRKPRLLILDEATAALDPENEAAVWSAVENLRGKTTVVAISHQPALAGVADRLYRIENGRAERVSPSASIAGSAQEVA
jgi:ATP-binding cassette subfamily C protein